MTEANSSGVELPAAMKVAPATSSAQMEFLKQGNPQTLRLYCRRSKHACWPLMESAGVAPQPESSFRAGDLSSLILSTALLHSA